MNNHRFVSGAVFFKLFRSRDCIRSPNYLSTLVFRFLSTPFLSGSLSWLQISILSNTSRHCVLISLFAVPVSWLTRQLHVKTTWAVGEWGERAAWVGQGWITIANPRCKVAIFSPWQFVCHQGVCGRWWSDRTVSPDSRDDTSPKFVWLY